MERVVLSPFFFIFFFVWSLGILMHITSIIYISTRHFFYLHYYTSLFLFTLLHIAFFIYIITHRCFTVIVHVAIQDRAHAPFFFPQTEPRRHLSLARAFSLSLSRSPVLSLSRSHSAENDLNRFNKQDVTGCRTLTITLYKPTLTLPN